MVKVPGCNAIVDGFQYTSNLICPNYVFFLTHMHSDHYKGLSPSWNRGPIYCSSETSILLKDLYPDIPRVIPLELNVCHWISLDSNNNSGVNVTFFDANHCVGSIMILFSGQNIGNILYTGDFRFKESMLKYEGLLDSTGNLIKINHLFLDNTFSDPEFNFPAQETCFDMIKNAIEENPESDVWIKIECFGRESILIEISKIFNTLIVVDCKMYRRISLLNLCPERFSTNDKDGYIKVVNSQQMRELYLRNKNQIKTIGIWLSGWTKHYYKSIQDGVTTYKIPFSLHCSSSELSTFTNAIKAEKVTFTSSCAKKSKGNEKILEETYINYNNLEQTPHILEEISPVRRKFGSGNKTVLKKIKKPERFGSKIK